MPLELFAVECPYCGETIDEDIEVLREAQIFISDCPVCCRPIRYEVAGGAGDGAEVTALRSD